jgi:MscS family membrane protein
VADLVERKVMDESQIFTIDKFASLAMYCIAASCIAEVLGFTLKSFLAVGGVSGLAVGVAAQVVVGNMFGGAALFLTRPFVVGEKIKAGDVLGRVQDIGFMQTKVTGFDGVPVYVPNNAFTSQVITNFSRAKTMVLEASMQLNNRHIFLVHVITEKVQDYLRSHSHVEKIKSAPICYLKSMQNDGPVIALSCVIKAQRGPLFFTIQQEILIHVAQIITDILGPDSPFTPLKPPSSDVNFMKNQESKLVL